MRLELQSSPRQNNLHNLTDEQILRTLALKRARIRPLTNFKSRLFGKQQDFFSDPSKTKAAICSRRAGKTEAAVSILGAAMERRPGEIALFLALTRRSARAILWPKLIELNRKMNLGWELIDSQLEARHPNGSVIQVLGADMPNFIDRLRGARYSAAVIDEAGSFGAHLQSLVEDILEPALLDLDGEVVLIGTPGMIPRGYFYDATNGKLGYSVHHWTLLDNPHIPHAAAYLERLLDRRKWTRQNPTFMREWLGLWVVDLDSLFYKFSRTRNLFSALPSGHTFTRILGVDYGFNDACSFSIVTFCDDLPITWVEHNEAESGLIPSVIAQRIQKLQAEFSPVRIVADTGGLGKSITEEMIQRYHIPVEAADKTEKLTFVSLMNGDFVDGNLKVHASCTELINQYETLGKDPKKPEREDQTMPNDRCDSTLYAYRASLSWAHDRKAPEKTPEEILADQEKQMEDEAIESFLREKENEEWMM